MGDLLSLTSLPAGYRALVIGAGGAIGAAFVAHLQADPRCAQVLALHRQSQPPIDVSEPASIAQAAAAMLAAAGSFHLVVLTTGVLHGEGYKPEKRLADLSLESLETVFRINTFGPALVLRHFTPLLDRSRSVMAVLSAKVGSIGDNRLGGWTSYRASKSALNMVVKTAAIELQRSNPAACLIALHPGTVRSPLSRPFRGDEIGRPPEQATAEMLAVLDGLESAATGRFLAYDGQVLPW